MTECEECICLPMCINQVDFNKNEHNEFGYTMQFNGLSKKCDYFSKSWHNDKHSYSKIKLFFLEKKGLVSG